MTLMHLAQAAIVVVGGIIAVLLGSTIVDATFKRIDNQPDDASPGLRAAARHLRGGMWIGRLERLATYACLMAGFPAGLAMVLAVKGLARYPELKASSAGAAERFIIGTFISILWAAALAGVAGWALWLLP